MQDNNKADHMCNCWNKHNCPLDGDCTTEGVVYKAEVVNEKGQNNVYFGCAKGSFKKWWYNHRSSFKIESYKHCRKVTCHV